MSQKFPTIVSAVTAAVISSNASAAVPTFAQAANATAKLVMAGSSAAAPVISSFVQNSICGGSSNTLVVTSSGGTKQFYAFSCFIPSTLTDPIGAGAAIPANSLVTIYYRGDGDDFVGAVPIATGKQIKRLNLADPSCTGTGVQATCTVSGTEPQASLNDTWFQAVVSDTVQLGVTDVEPAQLTNANHSTSFSTSAYGSATTLQMQFLASSPLFQQVFALAVNTSAQSFSTVNLSRAAAADILDGTTLNWNQVPDALTGNPVSSTSAPIERVNIIKGGGSRAAANIYFFAYQCGGLGSIPDHGPLNLSQADTLALANSTPGSIVYTTIDPITPFAATYPNLVLATLSGLAPKNQYAATVAYDFWYEATLVPNPFVSSSSQTATLSNYLTAVLPDLLAIPGRPELNVIPFASAVGDNNPALPLVNNGLTGNQEVFVSPYTRGGNSCTTPFSVL